nr:uncharacterized protein LOC4347741 isoform X3 [Oryza sativa Japonica Group]
MRASRNDARRHCWRHRRLRQRGRVAPGDADRGHLRSFHRHGGRRLARQDLVLRGVLHRHSSSPHAQLLVFWNLVIDRLTVRTSVFPTLTTVLDSQLNAVPSRHRRAEVSGDLTGRSYPVVMGMRLAAVDQLPVIKLTAAQTDATGACPICLHVRRRRRSTINTPPSSMNKCTIRDASFTVYSELFCFSFFSPFCRRISRPARLPGDCRRVATSSIWGASTTGCCGMPYAQCAVVLSTKCRCT